MRKAKKDTKDQADNDCHDRLAKAYQEAEDYATHLHEVRMKAVGSASVTPIKPPQSPDTKETSA